jgi:hypothetical protein
MKPQFLDLVKNKPVNKVIKHFIFNLFLSCKFTLIFLRYNPTRNPA